MLLFATFSFSNKIQILIHWKLNTGNKVSILRVLIDLNVGNSQKGDDIIIN